MTERDRVRHLLRRLGLGALPEEVDAYTKLGAEKTAQILIEYDKQPDTFNVSPWEICREDGKDEIYLDSFRPAVHWALQMCMTSRPLQEKLTLFWHDHFAVSGQKVEFGPSMQSYVDTLRTHAAGNFGELLKAVSQEPAMIFFLDTHMSVKGQPNENFGREVMELFTLGIGNYTEKDVQEAARAFTGWGLRYALFERGGEKVQEIVREAIAHDNPVVAFADSPKLHDAGVKTILGQSKKWKPDDVLDMLAGRPETAQTVCRKLWSFFAYPDPDPAVVNRLAKVFTDGNGEIKPVLYAMVQSPEFWSDKCVRRQVKSPVDFVIPVLRQLGVGAFLAAQHPKAEPTKPLPALLRGVGGIAYTLCSQMGMGLLFPPTVAGWNWGEAWISSDSMRQRMTLGGALMGQDGKDKGGANAMLARINQLGKPNTPEEMTDRVLAVLDVDFPPEKRLLVVEACRKNGGPATLTSGEKASPCLAAMLHLIFASPDFQFC